jgi:hypothetical protein
MALTKVDLPEPDTPVTAMSWPRGNDTVTFCRLCSTALCTVTTRPLVRGRREAGSGIERRPER